MAFPNTYMANPLETVTAADQLQQREMLYLVENNHKSAFPIQSYKKVIETDATPFSVISLTPGRGQNQWNWRGWFYLRQMERNAHSNSRPG